jgi:hypothetical protein
MENVAFVGKMASGKSYYTSLLQKRLMEKGISSNAVHISAKIKEIATDLFNMQGKDRDLLQKIAGNMREIDPDVWIKCLISNIKKEHKQPFIIDDMRFKREEVLIKQDFDLLVVKIDTDDAYRIIAYTQKYGRAPTEKELNDVTETSSEDIVPDLVLENDYTKPTAERNIDLILRTLQI